MAEKPKSGDLRDNPLVKYVAIHLEMAPEKLTHKEIASRLGYPRSSNIVSMWVSGLTKIPVHQAPGLAKILGLDPAHFTRMVMKEYMPELLEAIETTMGGFVTKNETKILNIIRTATKNEDPSVVTKDQEKIIRDAAKEAFI